MIYKIIGKILGSKPTELRESLTIDEARIWLDFYENQRKNMGLDDCMFWIETGNEGDVWYAN